MTGTRDLTEKFLKLRDEKKSRLAPVSHGEEKKIQEIKIVDPIYCEASKIIERDMENLKILTHSLHNLYTILEEKKDIVFDEEKLVKLIKQEEDSVVFIRQHLSQIQKDIKRLQTLKNQASTSEVQILIHNKTLHLIQEFSQLSKQYYSIHYHKEILKSRDPDLDQELYAKSSDVHHDKIQLDASYLATKQRNDAIIRLSEEIKKLADLFNQLNMMIIEQGSVLDRIDYNIVVAEKNSKKGTREVKKSETYQRNSQNRAIKFLGSMVAALGATIAIKKAIKP